MSDKANHTPGPWRVVVPKRPLQGFTHAIDSPSGSVAWAFPPNDDLARAEANARLIAAAPDLLTLATFARETAITILGESSDENLCAWAQDLFTKASSAIAKASGN